MWIFEAKYINMDTEEDITRTIKVDETYFNNAKDIFLYAMNIAYEMIQKNECFSSLEFIAC